MSESITSTNQRSISGQSIPIAAVAVLVLLGLAGIGILAKSFSNRVDLWIAPVGLLAIGPIVYLLKPSREIRIEGTRKLVGIVLGVAALACVGYGFASNMDWLILAGIYLGMTACCSVFSSVQPWYSVLATGIALLAILPTPEITGRDLMAMTIRLTTTSAGSLFDAVGLANVTVGGAMLVNGLLFDTNGWWNQILNLRFVGCATFLWGVFMQRGAMTMLLSLAWNLAWCWALKVTFVAAMAGGIWLRGPADASVLHWSIGVSSAVVMMLIVIMNDRFNYSFCLIRRDELGFAQVGEGQPTSIA